MSSLIPRATEISHRLLALAVQEGDTVIDATAGQGRDACFLAALVGESGRVWAFDVQEEACRATRAALAELGFLPRARVIRADHAGLAAYDIEPAAAAIFNLGWLPGSDHTMVSGANTAAALQAALHKLKIGGALVVVAYPGHEAGATEYAAVQNWLQSLPKKQARAMQITFPLNEQAPVVLLIEKLNVIQMRG